MTETARILGIDPGERRVGLAVSDPLGVTAQGLDTFDRRRGDLFEHIAGLVAEYGVTGFVVDDVDTATAAVGRIAQLDRRAARRHVEEHFSAERMTDGYLRVYQQVRRRCHAS